MPAAGLAKFIDDHAKLSEIEQDNHLPEHKDETEQGPFEIKYDADPFASNNDKI